MGNGQSQDADVNRSVFITTHADRVFANFEIIWNILGMLENEDIQRSRRVNKTINFIACKILSRRKNGAEKFYGSKVIPDFVNRMETRLEETIPYSAFTFDLDRIPVSHVKRFGTNFGPKVRKVTLNLDFEPPSPTTWFSFIATLLDPLSSPKVKALLLLTFTPNLEQLCLKFKNRKENVLTLNDLARLQILPKLKILEICDPEDRCPLNTMNLMSPLYALSDDDHQSHMTFVSAVMRKAPSLNHVKITRVDRHLCPTLKHLPTLFSEMDRTPPALTLDLHFMLSGATNRYSSYPSHRDFMNELTNQAYTQLHELCVTIVEPTVDLMDEFWEFIGLQAQSLQKLQLFFLFLPFPSPRNLFQFPAMPNLTSLDLCVYHLLFHPIPLITLNPALFPKLGPLRTEYKTGFFPGNRIRGNIDIISSNSNSTNLKP